MEKKTSDQFYTAPEGYLVSEIHAKGQSLSRMMELLPSVEGMRALDIGTGAGHTGAALMVAGADVILTDVSLPMLCVAHESLSEWGMDAGLMIHTAEGIPFPDEHFDLLTCRLAAHHFGDVSTFISESARVLKMGGIFVLIDNVTDPDPKAARYFNTIEKFRDPGHAWAYTLPDWESFLSVGGLTLEHSEIILKRQNLDEWASRAGKGSEDITRLKALILNGPDPGRSVLKPEQFGDTVFFTMQEALIIARK